MNPFELWLRIFFPFLSIPTSSSAERDPLSGNVSQRGWLDSWFAPQINIHIYPSPKKETGDKACSC